MAQLNVTKDISGRITVSFPYNPLWVEKIKTIPGHRWHSDKKHWSFPDSDGTLEKILRVFEGEKIHIDPALIPSPLAGEGQGEGNFIKSEPTPTHAFKDLRRELLSRKYSYNRDKRNRFVYNPKTGGYTHLFHL